MNETHFQPATSGAILTGGLQLFYQNMALLVPAAFLPQLVLLGLGLLLVNVLPPDGAIGTLLVLGLLASGYVLVAQTRAIAQVVLEEPVVLLVLLRHSWDMRVLPMVAGYVALVLLVTTGLQLFIVPGLLLGGLFAPLLPAIVIERRGLFSTVGRSVALVRGDLLKCVGVFSFFLLATWFVPLVLLVAQLESLGIGPFTPLLFALLNGILLPIGYVPLVLLYISLRAKGGYTPDLLREELVTGLRVEPPLPKV